MYQLISLKVKESYAPINHFHGAKLPVLIQSTPYESSPDVIGLELPIAHIQGMSTACSSYVKNMDKMSKKAGTMHASAIPRKKRTTKSDAKLLHGICNRRINPLTCVSVSDDARGPRLPNLPDNKITGQPLRYWKALECEVLRPFGYKIPKIEYTRQPIVLVCIEMCIFENAQDSRASELFISRQFI